MYYDNSWAKQKNEQIKRTNKTKVKKDFMDDYFEKLDAYNEGKRKNNVISVDFKKGKKND